MGYNVWQKYTPAIQRLRFSFAFNAEMYGGA